ncbi:MAG: helix-hairpin-helix domain-containing protein [Bacteroidia bacterium]|nr:helix-hairpin-helix domain-containing protein [Bacteroidia bacterium]MCZ2247339.1 helix-hairpin-helix domain-containing protein [Bacteroidia bacterium]
MKIKKVIKDFFTFERRGKKGILLLSIILFLQLIVYWVIKNYEPKIVFSNKLIPVNPALLDSLDKSASRDNSTKATESYTEDVIFAGNSKNTPVLFTFNPNTISDRQWEQLGLSSKQIKSIRNYFKSGGYIDYPEEVFKVRAVDKATWERLLPYIKIDREKKPEKKAENKELEKDSIEERIKEKERKEAFIASLNFEINTCTRSNLIKLNLLDSLTTVKIIRYRNALGGYVSLEQLYEIEGADTTNFNKLIQHLSLDLNSVRTININKCSVSQLSKHPYVSYNVAVSIVNYRQVHGDFQSSNDLKKCLAVSETLINKLKPYLRFKDGL